MAGDDTIITLNSSYQDVIRTAETFAFEDIKLLNLMYKCPRTGRLKAHGRPVYNGFSSDHVKLI